MNLIEHIIKPDRLLLLWISPGSNRMNRIVAELIREGDNASLRYLHGEDDFQNACEEGFNGYPYLPINDNKNNKINEYNNIIDVFIKRLPPKSREDYSFYLESIRLPSSSEIDDFTLLGYSGAKLPDDDFSLVHVFDNAGRPFELLTEVSGAKYNEGKDHYNDIIIGESVTFEDEPMNRWDKNAIAVYYQKIQVGYIGRGILNEFHKWLGKGYNVTGTIEKKNGTSENPRFFIFVTVV